MALSAARNTISQSAVHKSPRPYKQKASVTIYQGALVVLNAGYAAPGTAAASLVAIGRAKKTTVTGAGDGSNPTGMDQPYIEVEEGTFKWNNSSGDAVVAADVGATVYIEDDQTVCHTVTGKSAAGRCIKLDSDGVWVETTVGVP